MAENLVLDHEPEISIHEYRDLHQVAKLPGLLMLFFRGGISGYVSNRRRWDGDDSIEQI